MEKAIRSGHALTKPGPGKASKYGEKRTMIRNIGRLNITDHLVKSLNIDSNFCHSPLLCSSAIVGAKTLLIDSKGMAIKLPNLIAAPYCPIATSETPKVASKMVSIESSTVSMIVVKKLNE